MRRTKSGGYHITSTGQGLLAALGLLLVGFGVFTARVTLGAGGGGAAVVVSAVAAAASSSFSSIFFQSRSLLQQQEEDEERPDPRCSQPSRVTGPCRGAIPRWTYDQATGSCAQFTWGGCARGEDQQDAVANRFESEAECRAACEGEDDGAGALAATPTMPTTAAKGSATPPPPPPPPSAINVTSLPPSRLLADETEEEYLGGGGGGGSGQGADADADDNAAAAPAGAGRGLASASAALLAMAAMATAIVV
jgi:hypothetical protein